jgi:hypothetical protein
LTLGYSRKSVRLLVWQPSGAAASGTVTRNGETKKSTIPRRADAYRVRARALNRPDFCAHLEHLELFHSTGTTVIESSETDRIVEASRSLPSAQALRAVLLVAT